MWMTGATDQLPKCSKTSSILPLTIHPWRLQVCGSTRLGNFSTSSSWSCWLRYPFRSRFFFNLEVLDEFFFTSHHRVPESLRTTQLQFLSAQHLKQFNHSQQRSPAPNHLLLSSTSTSGHFLLDCGEKKFASSAATKPNQITAEMSQKLHTELQFKLSHWPFTGAGSYQVLKVAALYTWITRCQKMPSIWKIKSYIHVIHVSPFLLKVEKTRQTSNSRCPTAKCNFNKHRRGDFQQPFGRFLPIVLVPDVGWRLVFDALDDCNMSQQGFCVKVVLLQPLRSAPQNSAFAHCQRTWGMYLEQMLWTIRCSCSKTKELREGLELSSCTPSGGKTSEANGHIEAILQTLVLFLSVGPPRSGHHQFPCFAIFENQWKLQ